VQIENSGEYEATLEKLRTDAKEINSIHSTVMHDDNTIQFFTRLMRYGEPFYGNATGCMKMSWMKDTFGGVHGGVSVIILNVRAGI